MLSIFRKNHFIRSLLLLAYAILLKLPLFFYPDQVTTTSKGYLSSSVLELVPDAYSRIVLAIILCFVQAVYLNKIVIENRITREMTLFPGMFYILLTSIFPETASFTPALMGLTFMLASLDSLFEIYKKGDFSGNSFNTGFFVSLASLFYYPFIFFLLLIVIGISIIKFLKVVEIFRLLLGSLIPYLLVLYYFIWIGQPELFLPSTIGQYLHFITATDFQLSYSEVVRLLTIFIILILSIFNYGQFNKKKNVQATYKIDVLFWMALLSGVSLIICYPLEWDHLYTIFIPLSIFLSMLIINTQNNMLAEFFHIMVLMLGFFIHYLTFTQL